MKSATPSLVLSGILILSGFLAKESFAGDKAGNGGNAVVCKGADGKVKSAEILDLYEGRALRGITYKESADPALEQALAWAGEVGTALGQPGDPPDGFVRDVKRLYASLHFLPPGTGLRPIPDSDEFIVPKNCTVTQTANYQDSSHIYVDSDVWAQLSQTQRAALVLHEAVYEHYRVIDTDSTRARRTVAYVVSGQPLPPAFDSSGKLGKDFLRCFTGDAWEAGRPATDFGVYRSSAGGLTVVFYQWAGHSIIARTTLAAPANRVTQPWPELAEPLSIAGNLNSAVDGDTVVSLRFTDATHGTVVVSHAAEKFECTRRPE